MSEDRNKVSSVRVEINAPASFVWEVLVDLPRYSEWNPFTVRVESTLKVGEPVHLYIADPANPGAEIHVIEHLVAYEPSRLLAWEQRPTEDCADAARRDQVIQEIDEKRCAYYTTDQFLGENADKITATFGEWVKAGFDGIAGALKKQAEALYATAAQR
ncbi:polyketide cyclase/dehydrase/lipid transport protein [Paraburkholderia sp. BL18I3N2]|uniref:SRPBCC domain-containing protein n=1 Tax=Paraburkholderia sp. BL18I3N2 TaxID=1938799 RepID=UPI000D071221|nr:SRPBCC domain-containing protein [Paraburkholderia sp. BL18I3N2]PRX27329.1 polyketide cyclase/dehydrase/lipid transport protein [Paraburkholderia sp. BL18I3N2]